MSKAPPWTYRLMVLLLSPLMIGYTVWRSVKDGGWRYFKQRLGFSYPKDAVKADLWVHAASVGEVTTVLPLLESVLASSDNSIDSILLTTNTPTAKQVLDKRDIRAIHHAYLPIDFSFSCRRFLSKLSTRQGWIVETEVWPRLYASCHQYQIALTIINARLSDKTLRHANGILGKSFAQALHHVQVLARSPEDKDRYLSMGADASKVHSIGNLKYMDNREQLDVESPLDRDYVLAASTHDDEELRVAREWLKDDSLPLLVLVPRHPERANSILQSLNKLSKKPIAQRSQNGMPEADDRLYLADTLGEMQSWYKHASAAFVGGSLIKRGGHNMLEPARFSVPVIVGPHTHNFVDVMQMMQSNNAISVANDEKELTAMLKAASALETLYVERANNALLVAESLTNIGAMYQQALTNKALTNQEAVPQSA